MYKTLTILFLTAVMAKAQTTILCEDNFTSASVVGCTLGTQYSPNFLRQSGVLNYIEAKPSVLGNNFSISLQNDPSIYDTLKLEMIFSISGNSSFINGKFVTQKPPLNITLNYTDASNNKNYTGNMTESQATSEITLKNSTSVSYSTVTRKLITNIPYPIGTNIAFMALMAPNFSHYFYNASWGTLTPAIMGYFANSPNEDPGFNNRIKQAFCATTGNPTDCLAKVIVNSTPPFPTQLEIDNFKAYGIKKIVTGLEDEITPSNTRTLVGMYNSLGQKLDADQIHEGLVIRMYSDGTKEKVVMK